MIRKICILAYLLNITQLAQGEINNKEYDFPDWEIPSSQLVGKNENQVIAEQRIKSDVNHNITEDMLRADIKLQENLIETALVSQDWELLSDLLSVYRQMPNYNENLYLYANGALMRNQNKHDVAVAQYHQLLTHLPMLNHIRFDYMAMLFENKQYQQALSEASYLQNTKLPAKLAQLVPLYIQAIKDTEAWKFDATLQYERNNNVNNASEKKVLHIGNATFTREDDALPKSATGVKYGLGINRTQNISGNHFISYSMDMNGIYYWDNKDFNEENFVVQTGYLNQNRTQSFSILPFMEFSRYEGHFYNRKPSVQLAYDQDLGERFRLTNHLSRHWNHYVQKEEKERYNGSQNALDSTLIWKLSPQTVFYIGLDWSQIKTREQDESSIRRGIRIGHIQEWKNIIGYRVDLRYGTRKFYREHFLYPKTRRDGERQLRISVWSPKIEWHGFVPQLTYRYMKVDSNIPELYSRNNKQLMVEIERKF